MFELCIWFVKAKLGASREKLEELRSSPDVEMCSKPEDADQAISSRCQHLLSQAMELGFANLTMYYNDDVSIAYLSFKFFRSHNPLKL